MMRAIIFSLIFIFLLAFLVQAVVNSPQGNWWGKDRLDIFGFVNINASNFCTGGICFNASNFTTISSGDITEVNATGPQLTGGGTTGSVAIGFNTTWVNAQIDARADNDTDTDTFNTTLEMRTAVNDTEMYFTNVLSDSWTNVSITESQISDLSHTVDTFNTSQQIIDAWNDSIYAAGCAANMFVTNISFPITCTGISDVYLSNTGDTATGNYTFDSGTLHIDSSGNQIGINVTDPDKALEVAGDARIWGEIVRNSTGSCPREYFNATGSWIHEMCDGTKFALG